MKKDTLEEKIVLRIETLMLYRGAMPQEGKLLDILTSYRNDVLEEAHDEIKKLNAYGDGQIAFKHHILEVIKSLKVDI